MTNDVIKFSFSVLKIYFCNIQFIDLLRSFLTLKNNKESAITVELPENGKLVIQKLETFNIFTETVKYNVKNERNNSINCILQKYIFKTEKENFITSFVMKIIMLVYVSCL
jgi:hypothetical protein